MCDRRGTEARGECLNLTDLSTSVDVGKKATTTTPAMRMHKAKMEEGGGEEEEEREKTESEVEGEGEGEGRVSDRKEQVSDTGNRTGLSLGGWLLVVFLVFLVFWLFSTRYD